MPCAFFPLSRRSSLLESARWSGISRLVLLLCQYLHYRLVVTQVPHALFGAPCQIRPTVSAVLDLLLCHCRQDSTTGTKSSSYPYKCKTQEEDCPAEWRTTPPSVCFGSSKPSTFAAMTATASVGVVLGRSRILRHTLPNSRRLVVLVNVPPTHPPSIARGVAHPPYVNPKRLQHRCKRSGRHRRRRGHLRTQASNLAGTTSFSSLIDSRLRLGNKVMSRAWFRM